MNKFLVLRGVLGTAILMSACAEKKPLTPEEQWQGYCKSIGNAARSIILDRQNGILHKEALEYANKVTDPTTKKFVLEQVAKAYAYPADQLEVDSNGLQVQFRDEAEKQCLEAPFDAKSLPDYKPF